MAEGKMQGMTEDMTKGESIDILVVEDDQGDRDSIVKALQDHLKNIRVVAVDDGTEAMDFLLARGDWGDRVDEEPPKLILLDLELSGSEGGLSILGQVRSIEPDVALTGAVIVGFGLDCVFASRVTRSRYLCAYSCPLYTRLKPASRFLPDDCTQTRFRSPTGIHGTMRRSHH